MAAETAIGFLQRLATTSSCTPKDEEQLVGVMLHMGVAVEATCGVVYLPGAEPVSIHAFARTALQVIAARMTPREEVA